MPDDDDDGSSARKGSEIHFKYCARELASVCVCAYVSVRESEAHQTVCVTVSFFLFTLFGPELRNILSRLEKNGGGGDV